MRIQAAVVESSGGPFTVRELDLDQPRSDEILVRITAAGICHTDLSFRGSWPSRRCPMVFGHEGTGVVEAVGSDVSTVRTGDTVCLSYRSCGGCAQCTTGSPAYCAHSGLNARGTRTEGSTAHSRDGAPVFGNFFGQSSFATHALAYESNTVRIPENFPPALAAPLGCGVQTGAGTVLNVLRPTAGESLIVLGAGTVGLSALMTAVAEGCSVIAVDPVASRRALAAELGASAVLDPTAHTDVAAALRDLVPGGARSAIDTTGRSDVINQALGALERQGTLALVGAGATAEFDIMQVMSRGIRIRGVIEGDATPSEFIPRLIERHRRGDLPIDKLVTEFPFRDIEAAARATTSGAAIKPVLTVEQPVPRSG